ncbi:hypothetical protein EDD11_005411 [Mortierella claussenii]|nr:hypothetical protein EDD11_005411 [Mortierella claussenii]
MNTASRRSTSDNRNPVVVGDVVKNPELLCLQAEEVDDASVGVTIENQFHFAQHQQQAQNQEQNQSQNQNQNQSQGNETLIEADPAFSDTDGTQEIQASVKVAPDALASVVGPSGSVDIIPQSSPQQQHQQEKLTQYSYTTHDPHHHQPPASPHHVHHVHKPGHSNSGISLLEDKIQQKKGRRWSLSKVGVVPLSSSSSEGQQLQKLPAAMATKADNKLNTEWDGHENRPVQTEIQGRPNNSLKSNDMRIRNVNRSSLSVSTTCFGSVSRGEGPWGQEDDDFGGPGRGRVHGPRHERGQGKRPKESSLSSPSSSSDVTASSPCMTTTTSSLSSDATSLSPGTTLDNYAIINTLRQRNSSSNGKRDIIREYSQQQQAERPRICKMLMKHPVAKLDWKVPEPIKAGGEILRGVLVITAKELVESELKAAVAKTRERGDKKNKGKEATSGEWVDGSEGHGIEKKNLGQKIKHDQTVRVEHIEIELTGVEEATAGAGLLSRARTDQHCFLHKVQVLPVEDLKWIQGASSSFVPFSNSTPASPGQSVTSHSSSNVTDGVHGSFKNLPVTSINTVASAKSSLVSPTAAPSLISPTIVPNLASPTAAPSLISPTIVPNLASPTAASETFRPGCVTPGTQQGIAFQMRIPEKVGGTFKNSHASISYQLTANVHIRLGKEAFVLQHPMPLSLFELVQICAATKITSPQDTSPATSTRAEAPNSIIAMSVVRPSSCSTSTVSAGQRQPSSVRFVLPRANSVLGTAVVKPYSLWGLRPAASSQSHHYPYRSSHGYGRHQHQRDNDISSDHQRSHKSHQREASFHATTTSPSPTTLSLADQKGIACSHSAISAPFAHPSSIAENGVVTEIQQHKTQFQQNSEIITAEDSYPRLQGQQQQHFQSLPQQQQQRSSRAQCNNHGGLHNKDHQSFDGLDEVGFGAHIDKSVAPAGDQVTLDMFVVKSNMMKVVDIKVSLVETAQIFALLEDHEKDCHSRTAVMLSCPGEEYRGEETHQNYSKAQNSTRRSPPSSSVPKSRSTSMARRKLVDTHVVKIAKDYVSAQSEESHANDNHLKGYYEDYEDFRTAKSLSMYKLSMRIPENALTILDRELFKVEYMFVIKFFFKGRMGAFLELPVEIVSQYNHNRISTISGAISCVSNSVQIALPPVPILIKRSDGFVSDVASDEATVSTPGATKVAEGKMQRKDEGVVVDNIAKAVDATCKGQGSASAGVAGHLDVIASKETVTSPTAFTRSAVEQLGLPKAAFVKDAQESGYRPTTGPRSSSLRTEKWSSERNELPVRWSFITDTILDPVSENGSMGQRQQANSPHNPTTQTKEGIRASLQISSVESEAYRSNAGQLTAEFMEEDGETVPSASLAMGKEIKNITAMAASGEISNRGPSVLHGESGAAAESIDAVPNTMISGDSNNSSDSSKKQAVKRMSSDSSSSSFIASSSASKPINISTLGSMYATTVIKSVSPSMSLLFGLTSAALPAPLLAVTIPRHATADAFASGNTNGNYGKGGSSRTNNPITTAFISDGFLQHQPRHLLPVHQTTPYLLRSPGESDSGSTNSSRDEVNGPQGSTGLAAKIAKSLSSPLLRSRNIISGGGGFGGVPVTSSSPNGSSINLARSSASHSQQQQQSMAFALAATSLSTLTLLSSVGQAVIGESGVPRTSAGPSAINNHRSDMRGMHMQYTGRSSHQAQMHYSSQPLKSCLKERRGSAPVSIDTTLMAPSSQGHGRGQSKKVTFAKGSTPLPSPTSSQVLLTSLEYGLANRRRISQQMGGRGHELGHAPFSTASTFSSSPSLLTVPPQASTATLSGESLDLAAANLDTVFAHAATANASSQVQNDKSQILIQDRNNHIIRTSSIIAGGSSPSVQQHSAVSGTVMKSPNSASPQARMHHPFDDHPSRLSPLEKQHMDLQFKVQNPLRSVAIADLKGQNDDGEEEDGIGDEKVEHKEGEEGADDVLDGDDDESETKEQRIERHRQARVAWLAKYGDAFKQVYGIVPELPPI